MSFLTYWKLGIALIALFITFGLGWYVKGEIDAVRASKFQEAVQQAAIVQQNSVIAQERHATTINNQAEFDYAKSIDSINGAYAGLLNGLQSSPQPANGNLPAISAAASGTRPASRATSKAYGLTFRQCDVEEAKLIALWNDWKTQAQ